MSDEDIVNIEDNKRDIWDLINSVHREMQDMKQVLVGRMIEDNDNIVEAQNCFVMLYDKIESLVMNFEEVKEVLIEERIGFVDDLPPNVQEVVEPVDLAAGVVVEDELVIAEGAAEELEAAAVVKDELVIVEGGAEELAAAVAVEDELVIVEGEVDNAVADDLNVDQTIMVNDDEDDVKIDLTVRVDDNDDDDDDDNGTNSGCGWYDGFVVEPESNEKETIVEPVNEENELINLFLEQIREIFIHKGESDFDPVLEEVANVLEIDYVDGSIKFHILDEQCVLMDFKEKQNLDQWLDAAKTRKEKRKIEFYNALVALQDESVVPNASPFTCKVCFLDYEVGEGIMLKNCLHTFCRECLTGMIVNNESQQIGCPYIDDAYSCDCCLQQCEIKELSTEEVFNRYLARTLAMAKRQISSSFQCKAPNCEYWETIEVAGQVDFICKHCSTRSCIACEAVHENKTCAEYAEDLRRKEETVIELKKNLEYLKDMTDNKLGMECPQCKVFVTKIEGCDWILCTMCQTELCWATKQRRWGPLGKGDTSEGCRCNVNGVKCTPACRNCH